MYSIMADEVTSHNTKLMPLCLRFFDENHIREQLLEICPLPRITGQHTAAAIKDALGSLRVPLSDCRGQGQQAVATTSEPAPQPTSDNEDQDLFGFVKDNARTENVT